MRRKRKRPITFKDLTTLTGTEFYQLENGVTFYLEDTMNQKLVSCAELLEKFYKINCEISPVAFTLQEEHQYNFLPEKSWWMVLRGGFHIIVRKHFKQSEGPHCCQLWFRSHTDKQQYWIATLQLCDVFFFNEDQMKEAILKSVNGKEFYMNPQDAKKVVIP